MKKIIACILFVLLALAAVPNTAYARHTSQRRAQKNAQKAWKKSMKQQRKESKRAMKEQRKATKQWRKHHKSPF